MTISRFMYVHAPNLIFWSYLWVIDSNRARRRYPNPIRWINYRRRLQKAMES